VYFDYPIRVRGQGNEEKHPFRALIECDGFSMPDDDRFSLDGFEHLIRALAPLIHARLRPASLRKSRNRHPGRRVVNISTVYVPSLLDDSCRICKHFFTGVRRHGQASNLNYPWLSEDSVEKRKQAPYRWRKKSLQRYGGVF